MAVAILALSWVALILARLAGNLATIWPANGLLLGILLTTRRENYVKFLVTGLVASTVGGILAQYPLEFSLRLSVVNAIEVVVAVVLVRRHIGPRCDLTVPQNLWRFVLTASIVAPLLAASINALLRVLTGPSAIAPFVAQFAAHALGIVTVTPIVIALRTTRIEWVADVRTVTRHLFVLAFVLVTAIGVFGQSSYPLLFLIYPPLTLSVLSSGLTGGSICLLIVTFVSILMTVTGFGPMALIINAQPSQRIIVLQVFAVVAAIKVLTLSALLSQRDRAEQQLRHARDELEKLATTDGLTGLANRRRLDEVLDIECRRAMRDRAPLSFLLLDIDRFKRFNDTYGHQVGDTCLVAVADALRTALRRPADVAARYGGEELAVVLPSTDSAGAATLARVIRSAVEDLSIPHSGNSESGAVVTVSIGVATIDRPAAAYSPAALIGAADLALYDAKNSGRNRVAVYCPNPVRSRTVMQVERLLDSNQKGTLTSVS